MRAVFFVVAAAISLSAAADARTVTVSDLRSSERVMMSVRGARIERAAAAPVSSTSRADRRDAALSRCEDVRGNACLPAPPNERLQAETLTIILENGFSVSDLSFSRAPGQTDGARRNQTVMVNGRAYTLRELSALTLTGRIVIDLDHAAAAGLTLTSFELSDLAIPLPAAGLLMLAGLAGIALAIRRQKTI